ncbi:hypothetical protein PMIN01_06712 [Paraphaeosphaeria minitans]|uniref:Uncharacterized protein n=1 Tax=Paraphaeosphaeria minitans TaxID=565426 RepID=A0A9P6KQM7_9PLEO|nr:hypothetical protein PMIN01_06712 [Paraphaeosphaeria minitans]
MHFICRVRTPTWKPCHATHIRERESMARRHVHAPTQHPLVYLNDVACNALNTMVPDPIVIMRPLLRQFLITSQPRDNCLLHELFTFPSDVLGLLETFASPVNVQFRAAHPHCSQAQTCRGRCVLYTRKTHVSIAHM